MNVLGGHFITEDLAHFDAAFFNLSAETAAVTSHIPSTEDLRTENVGRRLTLNFDSSWSPYTRPLRAVGPE